MLADPRPAFEASSSPAWTIIVEISFGVAAGRKNVSLPVPILVMTGLPTICAAKLLVTPAEAPRLNWVAGTNALIVAPEVPTILAKVWLAPSAMKSVAPSLIVTS